MSKKIVVVGSINIDLVARVSRTPVEGETLLGQDFMTYPGGKGANQAVSAARLGGDVMMIGRLGNDAFAEQLRRGLDLAGVDTSCVRNVDGSSGTAVITVTENGKNSIIVVPGANASLNPGDLEGYGTELGGATVILSQLEIPLATVGRLGQMARSLGIPFLLDPAPAHPLPPEILQTVTWLTPNESETRSILNDFGYSATSDLETQESVSSAAQMILAKGARNVVLKLGDRGVYLAGKDVSEQFIGSFAVRAIDSTAAGDAFNGGFAYGLAEGMQPADAARFACAVAAISVTRSGAQLSMPTLSEVEELLSKEATRVP